MCVDVLKLSNSVIRGIGYRQDNEPIHE